MQKQIWQMTALPLFLMFMCLTAMAQIPGVTPPDHVIIVMNEDAVYETADLRQSESRNSVDGSGSQHSD